MKAHGAMFVQSQQVVHVVLVGSTLYTLIEICHANDTADLPPVVPFGVGPQTVARLKTGENVKLSIRLKDGSWDVAGTFDETSLMDDFVDTSTAQGDSDLAAP